MTGTFGLGPEAVTVALVGRSLTERRRFVVSLTVASFAIAWLLAALYPSVGVAYDDVLDDLPPAIVSMMGGADFSTPEGFIHVELFSFLGPAFAIAAGVSVAASALAGAEQNGQLALITASPVRRFRVALAAIGSTAVAVTVVSAGLFAGIVVGGALGNLGLPIGRVAGACLSVGLLGAAAGSLSLAAGAITGKRAMAVGVGAGSAVASYLVDAFFPLSAALGPFTKFSLWYPYGHSQPILHGVTWWHALLLLAIAVLACGAAVVGFERRDLDT